MNKRAWARVENGKIVLGPLVPPENYFSKVKSNNEISKFDVKDDGWLPVYDNSQEVDLTKFAVSSDFKLEILSDRVTKTHKIKEFPKEFIDAFNKYANTIKPSESSND